MNLCLLDLSAGFFIFFPILLPVKVREIPGKLVEVILIGGAVQNGKVDSPEHVFFPHAVVIKLLQRLIEQVRNHSGIIGKCAASEGPQHQVLIPPVCRHLKHPGNAAKHHFFILLLRHALHSVVQHGRRAGHHGNNGCLRKEISPLILYNLHLRVDDHRIGTHVGMQGLVIGIVRRRRFSLQGQKKRALPAEILLLGQCPIADAAAGIHGIGQIQHENGLYPLLVQVIGKLLHSLSRQAERIHIFTAIPASAKVIHMGKVLRFLQCPDILREKYLRLLHLRPGKL